MGGSEELGALLHWESRAVLQVAFFEIWLALLAFALWAAWPTRYSGVSQDCAKKRTQRDLIKHARLGGVEQGVGASQAKGGFSQ